MLMFLNWRIWMSNPLKQSPNNSHHKRTIFFLLRLTITFAIIFYLIKKIDFHYLASQMLHANIVYILLAIIVAMISYAIVAFRWRLVIKALNDNTLTKKQCFKLIMIGMFFNQFMLASVGGDAVRIWLTTRNNISTRTAINSTLFDRVFGLLALTILIISCLPIYLHALTNKLTFISLSILVSAVIVAMLLLLFLDRFPLLSRISFFQKILGTLSKDARTVFLSVKNARKPAAYAVFSIMMPPLIIYLIGQAYQFPITLIHCLAIIPPVILLSMLPISIAGWGVREGSMMVVASYLGITSSQAILVSVWFGISLLIASLPGAIFWLIRKETKPMKIDYEADATSP